MARTIVLMIVLLCAIAVVCRVEESSTSNNNNNNNYYPFVEAGRNAHRYATVKIKLDRRLRTATHGTKRQELPALPPPPQPNYNDLIWSMPVAGYIPWGRTHTNTTGSPQNAYTALEDQAYLTVVQYVNEVLGGVILNGSRYLILDINFNDGADCDLMMITYEYMVDKLGAKFLLGPITPDCSILAKFAESRGLIYLNGGDFTLPILRLQPNGTTFYDRSPLSASYADLYDYSDLQWTFNVMPLQEVTQLGFACAEAMTNPAYIDQTGVAPDQPARRVRTVAFASNEKEVPYDVFIQRTALLTKNVTEVYPNTNLDIDKILSAKCNYLWPTVIDEWIDKKPDFVMLITGASNSSIGIECMHQKKYAPPAFQSIASSDPTIGFDAWQLAGEVTELSFQPDPTAPDPVFPNWPTYAALYQQMWGYVPSYYEDTFAAAATILIGCINSTHSMDSLTVRQCIRAFNSTTVFGLLSFPAATGYEPDRSSLCGQMQADGSFVVAYPSSYPNSKPLQIPYPFKFNQTWLAQFKSHSGLSHSSKIGLGIGIGGFLLVILVVGGAFAIVRYKYHIMLFGKKTKGDGGDW